MARSTQSLASIGEKKIIREFIRPYFNASNHQFGVGDDCAMVGFGREIALFSTDRVPADLTAFRLGILDYRGLGDYLARLNLSDIAACGGTPVGLLLNLGLPGSLRFRQIQELCRGFRGCGRRFGVEVLGGDITHASELSISATSVGRVKRGEILTRRTARPGDSIFLSRPLGVTPAAFVALSGTRKLKLSKHEIGLLKRQFTHLDPLIALGRSLARSGTCGACMDNTDGVGQTLSELSQASQCAFIVEAASLQIPFIVHKVSRLSDQSLLEIAFGAGADFSLVGTLRGRWTSEEASRRFRHSIEVIGQVEKGNGVHIDGDIRSKLRFRGWNYFVKS
jgi:thiamine-monophosphate kinase